MPDVLPYCEQLHRVSLQQPTDSDLQLPQRIQQRPLELLGRLRPQRVQLLGVRALRQHDKRGVLPVLRLDCSREFETSDQLLVSDRILRDESNRGMPE